MFMAQSSCPISRWQQLKQQLNNLAPAAFLEAIRNTPGAIVVDVRTAEEYAAEHLPGAINLDYLAPGFWDEVEQLDPHRPYFVYCRSCRRSIRACTLMRNGGFAQVYNLDGGLAGCVDLPLPMVAKEG